MKFDTFQTNNVRSAAISLHLYWILVLTGRNCIHYRDRTCNFSFAKGTIFMVWLSTIHTRHHLF